MSGGAAAAKAAVIAWNSKSQLTASQQKAINEVGALMATLPSFGAADHDTSVIEDLPLIRAVKGMSHMNNLAALYQDPVASPSLSLNITSSPSSPTPSSPQAAARSRSSSNHSTSGATPRGMARLRTSSSSQGRSVDDIAENNDDRKVFTLDDFSSDAAGQVLSAAYFECDAPPGMTPVGSSSLPVSPTTTMLLTTAGTNRFSPFPATTTTTTTRTFVEEHVQYQQRLKYYHLLLQCVFDTTDALLSSMDELDLHYSNVDHKTTLVRQECASLLKEQERLVQLSDSLRVHLSYYDEADRIAHVLQQSYRQGSVMQKTFHGGSSSGGGVDRQSGQGGSLYGSKGMSASAAASMFTEEFLSVLHRLDDCLAYMRNHADLEEARRYRSIFARLHADALKSVKTQFHSALAQANNYLCNLKHEIKQEQKLEREKRRREDLAMHLQTGEPVLHHHQAQQNDSAAVTPTPAAAMKTTTTTTPPGAAAAGTSTGGAVPAMSGTTLKDSAMVDSLTNTEAIASVRAFVEMKQVAATFHSLLGEITRRANYSDDYHLLLNELLQVYVQSRKAVLTDGISTYLSTLAGYQSLYQLTRNATAHVLGVCQTEARLFEEFFLCDVANLSGADAGNSASGSSGSTGGKGKKKDAVSAVSAMMLQELLESVCNALYTTLRSLVIKENDLNLLCEVLVILKFEFLEEVRDHELQKVLAPLVSACARIMQDAKQRLWYRARMFFSDLKAYVPRAEDVNYPVRLFQKEEEATALAITEHSELPLSGSSSSSSSSLDGSSSPSRTFTTWYAPMAQTLLLLSKLYRCLEVEVFQYVAQEAVTICTALLLAASHRVEVAVNTLNRPYLGHGNMHGQLFLIRHFLILREQISPFQIEYASTEKELGFTYLRDIWGRVWGSSSSSPSSSASSTSSSSAAAAAASSSSSSASFDITVSETPPAGPATTTNMSPAVDNQSRWLMFMTTITTSAAPTVTEREVNSKKTMDNELKKACENLIASQTNILIDPLLRFFSAIAATSPASSSSFSSPSSSSSSLLSSSAHQTQTMRDAMVRAVSDKHMVVQLLAILRTMTAPLSTTPREGQSGERDRDNSRSDGMFHRNLMTLRRMTSLYVSNPVTETVLLRPVQRAVEDIIEQLLVFRTLAAEVQNAALKEELDLSLSKEVDERIAMLEQSMRTAFAT